MIIIIIIKYSKVSNCCIFIAQDSTYNYTVTLKGMHVTATQSTLNLKALHIPTTQSALKCNVTNSVFLFYSSVEPVHQTSHLVFFLKLYNSTGKVIQTI